METLDSHNQTHNDIKPQNYLVKYVHDENDLVNIEIALTDFGIAGADVKGGTPIFACPECLASTERKDKPDVFSLGRVFLFILLPKELFIEFLYVPVIHGKSDITIEIEKEPILHLIMKMMQVKNRISLADIKQSLRSIPVRTISKTASVISKIIEKSVTTETRLYVENLKKIS